MIKKLLLLLGAFYAILLATHFITHRIIRTSPKASSEPSAETTAAPQPSDEQPPEPTPEPTPETTPEPTLDPSVFRDSESLLLLANKSNPLSESYVPSDLTEPNVPVAGDRKYLRREAAEAIEKMFAGAKNDGVTLVLGSAYRSAQYQRTLYEGYVGKYGVARADAISARPGASEHQTGLAADMVQSNGNANGYDYTQNFESTPEGIWLREHAHEYGFILRYPDGKHDITGYAYEPWHFRYVGVDYATKIYETDPNMTFEEYFGVEGGNYKE